MISVGWKWIEFVADRVWPAPLELIFAATVLLLFAAVMQFGLRRAAASLRHRVWALTMGGLLLLPLLCAVLPKYPLPMGVRINVCKPIASVPEGTSETVVAKPQAAVTIHDNTNLPATYRPAPLVPPSSALSLERSAEPHATVSPRTKTPIGNSSSILAESYYWLLIVWAIGTGLYLLAMARVLWLERRLADSASILADPSWQSSVDELKHKLGIGWAVVIGVSQESEVPLTIGWRRPKIVLPVDCASWASDKRRAVLAHELSHVARHDVFWQVVARLACAVYWFHPLVWLGERRMRIERELACDDAVLRLGSQPDQYASVLLDVAAAISHRPLAAAAAIAMACRHPIQQRIRAILQPGLNRLPVGPRTGKLLLAGALLLVVLAAGLHPFATPQAKADPTKPAADDIANSDRHHGTADVASKPLAVTPSGRVAGKVIDENGNPLAGADVWLSVSLYGNAPVESLHTVADGQGRFVVEVSPPLLARMHWWDWSTTVCWAYAPGHQVGSARPAEKQNVVSEVVVQLGAATDTSFVILHNADQPCSGALVEPSDIRIKNGNIYGVPDDLLARISARTDANGHVKLPAVSRDTLFDVRVTAKDFGVQTQRLEKNKPPAVDGNIIYLRPAGRIEGRLIADTPEAVRDVRVFFSTKNRSEMPWQTEGEAEAKIDKFGRFFVPELAEGLLEIHVAVNQDQPLRPKLAKRVRLGAVKLLELSIPLVSTVLVRGSILENETKKPLPGALVLIAYGVGQDQSASSVTDSQGNYAVRVLPGRVMFHMIAAPIGYVQVGHHWDSDLPNDEIKVPRNVTEFDLPPVVLAPTTNIEGRLIDAIDRPVAKARVYLIADERHYGYGESDINGRFKLYDVAATIDLANAEFESTASDTGNTLKCVVLKTNPLILRALPKLPTALPK